MQSTLAKITNSHDESEHYSSISSEQQPQLTREEISFPPLPNQFANIYSIYTNSTDKIHQLHQKVAQLEQEILSLERFKNNPHFDENELDEIEEQSQFMIQYGNKCEAREKELQSLTEIYSGLKKLNSEANIFQNAKIGEVIIKYLESHRKVIAYKPLSQQILILCKQNKLTSKKVYTNNSNVPLNKSGSETSNKRRGERSRSKDRGEEHHEEKEEVSFSLRLLNVNNLIHTFQQHKMVELDVEINAAHLEQIKQIVEKQVNIIKIHRIHNKKTDLALATYSQGSKCFIILDSLGKISVIDSTGQIRSFTQIDKEDKVILMEIKNEQLWIGTSQGVIRLYSLQNGIIKLVQIVGCFYKDFHDVSSYILIGEPKVERVIFSIDLILYELNLRSFDIKQVSELTDRIENIIDSYIITREQICKLVVLKDKYEISRNELLNKWYYEYHPKNPDQKIIYIKQSLEIKVIVGDTKGNLKVISL